MRKLALVLAFLLLTTPLFAGDNSERLNELQAEAQQLQARSAEYIQIIQNINLRLAEIRGAVKELELMDERDKQWEENTIDD